MADRDNPGGASVGDDLRPRHSDGRGRPVAGAPAAAVRVERADPASTAVDGRLSPCGRSGDRQAGHFGDLPRRRRAAGHVQRFLDEACRVWGYPAPLRVPYPLIYAAAWLCERGATIASTPSPLTRDFVRLGRVPHWGDTRRAREELIPQLSYPTLESGLSTLYRRSRSKIRRNSDLPIFCKISGGV